MYAEPMSIFVVSWGCDMTSPQPGKKKTKGNPKTACTPWAKEFIQTLSADLGGCFTEAQINHMMYTRYGQDFRAWVLSQGRYMVGQPHYSAHENPSNPVPTFPVNPNGRSTLDPPQGDSSAQVVTVASTSNDAPQASSADDIISKIKSAKMPKPPELPAV